MPDQRGYTQAQIAVAGLWLQAVDIVFKHKLGIIQHNGTERDARYRAADDLVSSALFCAVESEQDDA